MKVIVSVEKHSPKEVTYPRLMIGDEGSIIEVLTKPDVDGNAIVVVRVSERGNLGVQYSFRVLGGTEKFEDFGGSITLSND